MGKVYEEAVYYYRWGANNVGIVTETPEVAKEVMEALNKAQGLGE